MQEFVLRTLFITKVKQWNWSKRWQYQTEDAITITTTANIHWQYLLIAASLPGRSMTEVTSRSSKIIIIVIRRVSPDVSSASSVGSRLQIHSECSSHASLKHAFQVFCHISKVWSEDKLKNILAFIQWFSSSFQDYKWYTWLNLHSVIQYRLQTEIFMPMNLNFTKKYLENISRHKSWQTNMHKMVTLLLQKKKFV